MKFLCTTIIGVMSFLSIGQSELPFRTISEYPEEYTENSVAARLIESLGFRYYWASEGLTDRDLSYKLSEDSRTVGETLKHIYDLSKIIKNSAIKVPNEGGDQEDLDYKELRSSTLLNLKTAVDILNKADAMDDFQIVFVETAYPFWNQINGPIADAIWHCGQIAILRRASGNPINSKVNHFSGQLRE